MQGQQSQPYKQPSNLFSGMQIEVVERIDQPGVWTVEAIDLQGDGDIFQTLFVGPGAEKRAREYARFKYAISG